MSQLSRHCMNAPLAKDGMEEMRAINAIPANYKRKNTTRLKGVGNDSDEMLGLRWRYDLFGALLYPAHHGISLSEMWACDSRETLSSHRT
jgi:hypothetical protein